MARAAVKFDFDAAHKSFVPIIEDRIGDLMRRYPRCPLREVRIYEPRRGDRSMGYTENGVISLNAYWFGRDPDVLRREGRDCAETGWHGPMSEESKHVLTHEFGHALAGAISGWKKWATDAWSEATHDPSSAISGYALSAVPEFWAEIFAAYDLGFLGRNTAREMKELIDGQ